MSRALREQFRAVRTRMGSLPHTSPAWAPLRPNENFVKLTVTALILFSSVESFAQAGACISNGGPDGWNYPAPLHKNIKYRINTQNASAFGHSGPNLRAATMLAAGAWNQQGNGRSFTYDGTTTKRANDFFGSSAEYCAAQGVDYSIIDFHDYTESGSWIGIAVPICCTGGACGDAGGGGSGTGNHIAIKIPRRSTVAGLGCPGSVCTWNYGNGFAGANVDLPGLLAHEFGHTGGVYHPPGGEAAVMATANKNPNFRVLWEYDFKCMNQLAKKRQAEGWRVTQTSGSFGAPAKFSGSLPIAKAMVGRNVVGSTAHFSTSYHRGSAISFSLSGNTSYVDIAGVSTIHGSGFSQGLWNETPETIRIFFSRYQDYAPNGDEAPYTWNGTHRVSQIRSSDLFVNQTVTPLEYCDSMTGFLTCNVALAVRSPFAPSFAWWNGGANNNRTVTAWMNHDRSDGGTSAVSNDIWIAVGSVTNSRLPMPTKTGIRTSVPPAVACQNNFSSPWDCILAYVKVEDMLNVIHVRRFSVSLPAGAHTYSISMDSEVSIQESTAEALTAWYSQATSKFYVAFRGAASSQRVRSVNTSQGTAWTYAVELGESLTGPSSVSTYQGNNNRVVYVR